MTSMQRHLLNLLKLHENLNCKILKLNIATSNCAKINSHTASISKIHRLTYARKYPTTVVYDNGASIVIRYQEPREIIKIPVDFTKLTPEERKKRLELRAPKTKVVIEDDFEEEFNLTSYQHLWKK